MTASGIRQEKRNGRALSILVLLVSYRQYDAGSNCLSDSLVSICRTVPSGNHLSLFLLLLLLLLLLSV